MGTSSLHLPSTSPSPATLFPLYVMFQYIMYRLSAALTGAPPAFPSSSGVHPTSKVRLSHLRLPCLCGHCRVRLAVRVQELRALTRRLDDARFRAEECGFWKRAGNYALHKQAAQKELDACVQEIRRVKMGANAVIDVAASVVRKVFRPSCSRLPTKWMVEFAK